MKKSIMLGIILILTGFIQTLFSLNAHAQTTTLDELDTDKDGYISIKEAVAIPSLLASFGKIDVDGNGLISKKELEASALRHQLKQY